MRTEVKCIFCGSPRTYPVDNGVKCRECGFITKSKHIGEINEKEDDAEQKEQTKYKE